MYPWLRTNENSTGRLRGNEKLYTGEERPTVEFLFHVSEAVLQGYTVHGGEDCGLGCSVAYYIACYNAI